MLPWSNSSDDLILWELSKIPMTNKNGQSICMMPPYILLVFRPLVALYILTNQETNAAVEEVTLNPEKPGKA